MSPDEQDIFFTLIVGGGPGAGEFVYDANGNLRSSNVGQATTDPVQGISCPQGFATYNGHGAVLTLLSTTAAAAGFFGYRDLGTSTQGVVIFAQVGTAAVNDPIGGTQVGPGLQGIDPIFADFIQVAGAVISMGVAAILTQLGRIQVNQAPTNAQNPFIVLYAPEQGTSGHLVMLMQGASPDGTRPAQFLIASQATGFANPVPVTKALAEIQGALALPNAALPAFISTAFQAASVAGVATGITGSGGLSGGIPLTQTDATTFTITATGANQASKAWSIPANDANAGTWYRLTVKGTGTEGSTAQNLISGSGLDGANTRTATAAALTLSAAFRYEIVIELHVKTTGAAGTCEIYGRGSWDTTAGPGVAGPFAFGSFASGGEPMDTTVAHTLRLNLGWSSATGAPTITTLASTFERLGP